MTHEQQFVLEALRAALKGEPDGMDPWKNTAMDMESAARIIVNNGILLTVYPVLGAFPDLQSILHDQYYAAVAQSIKQDHEGNHILKALDDAAIDCIALKGWEMRRLYPDIIMRQMADLDILVRQYNYPEIKKLMTGLGYSAEPESSWMHDEFSWNTITVEMHKRLTDDSGEIQKWEKEIWTHAVSSVDGTHVLRMSDEDFYIFHMIHMHNDFLTGRLGLRRIVDTWLSTCKHSELNWAYIDKMFEKMGLSLFAAHMERLGKAVMGEVEIDPNSETLLMYAFQYGINGSLRSYKLCRVASTPGKNLNSRKRIAVLSAVFMPLNRMKAHFPVLNSFPILLPLCWMIRIFQKLKLKRTRNLGFLNYSGLNDADYKEMKRFLEAGGC